MSSSQGCRGLWVCHPPAQVARLRRGLPRRAQGVSLRAELCRAGMTFRRLPKCFGQDLDSATSVSSDTSGKRAVPCSRATCSSRLHFSHLAGAGSYRSRARGRLFRCRCLPPQELSRLDGNQLQTYMLKALKNEVDPSLLHGLPSHLNPGSPFL